MAPVVPLLENKTVILFDEIMLKIIYLKEMIGEITSTNIKLLEGKDGIEVTVFEQGGLQKQYIIFLDYGACNTEICSPNHCLFEKCPLTVFWREVSSVYKYHSERSNTIKFLQNINEIVDNMLTENLTKPDYYNYFLNQIVTKIGF